MARETEAADAEVVTQEAWAPLAFGEGPRIGVLGDSGCGKTEAMRRLIAGYLKRSPGAVLVVDDKEARPQFVGNYVRDRDELNKGAQLDPDVRVVVFRGDRFDRQSGEVDPETIAEIQWKMAQRGEPSLVVYDELDKAADHGMWRAGDASTILWAFRRGRSSGAASLWGTQETQAVPAGAFNQSSMILVFRMTGAPLRLLKERGYLEGGAEAVIPTLPCPENPKERGFFVALKRGRPWDGKIYRYR